MKYFKDIKLKELSLQKILEKMNKTPHVAVGILQDEKVEGSFSITDLAATHEYGSSDGRIPARSFIRSTFEAKQKKYAKLISDLQSKIIFKNLTIKQALLTLGEVVSKDMVATINRGIEPTLKPGTIKRKKSTKPLVDTGRLKGSITHEIREDSL